MGSAQYSNIKKGDAELAPSPSSDVGSNDGDMWESLEESDGEYPLFFVSSYGSCYAPVYY